MVPVPAPAIQRAAKTSATSPPTTSPEVAEAAREPAGVARPAVLVDDDVAPAPGQVARARFLAELRVALQGMADRELAVIGRTTADCPYLPAWLSYYERRTAAQLERAVRLYARGVAGDAGAMLVAVVGRVRAAVRLWIATGEVTGIPVEPPSADLPPLPALQRDALAGATANARHDAVQVRARLGGGTALEPTTRARMEQAFGHSFANIRVHADSTAGSIASSISARAFTVGTDIGFGAGEYRPGSLAGDALIAHELAHTIQQASGGAAAALAGGASADEQRLERDADRGAAAAVAAAWGLTPGLAALGLGRASVDGGAGLRLQGCRQEGSLPEAAVGPIPDYDGLAVKPGQDPNSPARERIWVAMMRNPDQLDRVLADAQAGDPRGVQVWQALEGWWAAIGTGVADEAYSFECTLPVAKELLPCRPDWNRTIFLSHTRPGGARLREVIGLAYSRRSRTLGLRNAIIINGLNLLLVGWSTRAALSGEARALGEAPPPVTKPPVVEAPPPAATPPVAARPPVAEPPAAPPPTVQRPPVAEPPAAPPPMVQRPPAVEKPTTAAPPAAVTTVAPEAILESQAALTRANGAKAALPGDLAKKAVASDGERTLSGWAPPPSGFAKVPPEEVLAHSRKIGHTPAPGGPLDQVGRGGFPGKYHCSHAEKQMAVLKPNEPIGVTLRMCPDCIGFFQKQAAATGRPQIVTDPDVTRVFQPDGRIDVKPKGP